MSPFIQYCFSALPMLSHFFIIVIKLYSTVGICNTSVIHSTEHVCCFQFRVILINVIHIDVLKSFTMPFLTLLSLHGLASPGEKPTKYYLNTKTHVCVKSYFNISMDLQCHSKSFSQSLQSVMKLFL